MNSHRRLLLSALSLGSLALLVAACSGDDDDGGSHEITGGTYELTLSSVENDLCWPDDALVPPLAVGAIDLLVAASNGQFSISPNPAARFYFQPVVGPYDGNDIGILLGNTILTAGTNCEVAVSTSGGGLITGDDEFDLRLTAELDAATTGTGGCAVLEGETWPGATIPFPTLTEPSNGTCSVTFGGTAVLPE